MVEPPTRASFRLGKTVVAHGLVSATGQKYNGKAGIVSSLVKANGRQVVYFATTGTGNGCGSSVELKPCDLRERATPVPTGPTKDFGLEVQVARLLELMGEGGIGEPGSELSTLLACLRNDRRAHALLVERLGFIVGMLRSWHAVRQNPGEQAFVVLGEPDGSTSIVRELRRSDPRPPEVKQADAKQQVALFMRSQHAVLLLGALCGIRQCRKVAQSGAVVDILAGMVRSPLLQPYALETTLQLCSTVLNFAGSSDAKHFSLLARFFLAECGARARGLGVGATHARLLGVFNATGEKTFTHECAGRCLRWGDAFAMGEEATREFLVVVRKTLVDDKVQVVQEVKDSPGDNSTTLYCVKPKCASTESSKAKFQRCSRCQLARYCSRGCQKADWLRHKHECRPVGI